MRVPLLCLCAAAAGWVLTGAAFGRASAEGAPPGTSASALSGRWATPTRHGVVEIAPCGSSICGRLIDSDGIRANAQIRDSRNANVTLRDRPLKGLTILQGFHPIPEGWDGGTIYNAEDGGLYHARITVDGADRLRLRGCIVWPLCKVQTWTRAR